uniref:uncharacterized protein isoform X2 n=1 Tax=Myxine glutinosa TaxID=7769 RepID=UPI00358E2B91
MNRDVSDEDHRSNPPGSTIGSDGGNSVVPGDSPSDRGSRVGPPEDQNPGPDFIAKVKVKSEFVDDPFPRDEGFIVEVKVKSEYVDESSCQDKDVDGKLMVDPELMQRPLRGLVHPVKIENFQSDLSQSSQDALSNECVMQEPCESPPREMKNTPQLLGGIHRQVGFQLHRRIMSSFEEPPSKKQCTSYELCVFCQERTPEPLVDVAHANFKCAISNFQGASTTKTQSRNVKINGTCALIGQHIIQEFKSDRQVQYQPKSSTSTFRFTTETPLGVGLSLHSHHEHRSRRDRDMLYQSGVGVSCQRVKEIISKIATTVQENMNEFNGVYMPPGLLKNLPIRCSADNIDAKVDTADGRNTFHGTALAVYQQVPQMYQNTRL